MHVNIVQTLGDVANPGLLVLSCWRHKMNRVSRARLSIHEDFKVAIVSINRIRGTEVAVLS